MEQEIIQDINCVYSRNLQSLVDFSENENKLSYLKKHVTTCKSCDQKLRSLIQLNREIVLLIPKVNITPELSSRYQADVNMLVRNLAQDNFNKILHKYIFNIVKVAKEVGSILIRDRVFLSMVFCMSVFYIIKFLL